MRIREAAERSGVAAATIRYYEQIGLLDSVGRSASGYRVFAEADIRRLVFLRKARDLGFSLDNCRELLQLVTAPNRHSGSNARRTRELASRRLGDIDRQIEDLERMRELVRLHIDTLGDPALDCPVADNL